jgi:hypothetical protein
MGGYQGRKEGAISTIQIPRRATRPRLPHQIFTGTFVYVNITYLYIYPHQIFTGTFMYIICLYIYISAYLQPVYLHTYIYLYIPIYVCVYLYVYLYLHIYLHISISRCLCQCLSMYLVYLPDIDDAASCVRTASSNINGWPA